MDSKATQKPVKSLHLFPTTHWSLVERAGGSDRTVSRHALSDLLETYVPALRAYLEFRLHIRRDEADDLLQGFMADRVLEQNLVAKAQRHKGKFRTFLLTALDNYVSNQRVRRSRRRRNPVAAGRRLLPLYSGTAGKCRPVEVADKNAANPSDVFEVAWARQVVLAAVDGMRHECHASGRQDLWGVFMGRVLTPLLEGAEVMPYERLITLYGIPSVAEASNLLVTAKRMLLRHLKAEVGRYELDPSAVEAEIADLRAILSRR